MRRVKLSGRGKSIGKLDEEADRATRNPKLMGKVGFGFRVWNHEELAVVMRRIKSADFIRQEQGSKNHE